ncbi:MAG: phosphomethylpyrimidine synthase ThiC [Deltaproteobacteria bacterium]|nr:phosphomethylpyrimidine synthase ThiC [Deltaproteobacteria bacterium]
MTQLTEARKGTITQAMEQAAAHEGRDPRLVAERVARGVAVIPKNKARDFPARVIGQGFLTKVNANIGTSLSRTVVEEERDKLSAAVDAGADAVMDLSTGGDLHDILAMVLKESPVMVGTVPLYGVASQLAAQGKEVWEFTADGILEEIQTQAEMGVDFITVHCGVTEKALKVLSGCGRIMGMVSRGGSLTAEWMEKTGRENPLYERFDDLLDIARAHDVTLSLGDGLRPGAIHDAEDRAQVQELLTLGTLVGRARDAGVQVMVEGPGHVPLSRIAADVKMQKRLCDNAPYYVLGPLPTDVAPGWDHLVGAIGGALAAAAGVDFLCYVTPAEHLCLPTAKDVRDGVLASRIAAHIGDLEKGVPGAADRDRKMSEARRAFDWETMFRLALDPQTARSRRAGSEDRDREVCTMCGDLCALKTFDRAFPCDKEK